MQAKIGKIDQYILDLVGNAIRLQGEWNADTNIPDISAVTTVGNSWIVTVPGDTNIGGITDWLVGDIAVKTATGWIKVDNTEPDFSGYVPYTGATGDVDLGSKNLKAANVIQTSSGTVNRTGNYISSVVKGSRTLTVTRDGNNRISSVTDGTNTWTLTRNASNYITSWGVS